MLSDMVLIAIQFENHLFYVYPLGSSKSDVLRVIDRDSSNLTHAVIFNFTFCVGLCVLVVCI